MEWFVYVSFGVLILGFVILIIYGILMLATDCGPFEFIGIKLKERRQNKLAEEHPAISIQQLETCFKVNPLRWKFFNDYCQYDCDDGTRLTFTFTSPKEQAQYFNFKERALAAQQFKRDKPAAKKLFDSVQKDLDKFKEQQQEMIQETIVENEKIRERLKKEGYF